MARPKHTFHPTQSISLTISIIGDQHVQIDSHGGRELGSNVVVITDHVAVYVYDQAALATYANAWIDASVTAHHQLPSWPNRSAPARNTPRASSSAPTAGTRSITPTTSPGRS